MSFRFSSPSEEIAIASCTTPQLTVCPAETTLQSEPSSSPEPDFDLEEAEVRVKRDPSADGDSSEAELAQLDVHVKQDPSFDDDDAFNARMEKKEKKTVKKRRCWGQELPAPKTNLPPRKRAKTQDEKEQRRIERVLRNRAAAQTSRERKRQEVEKLESEKRKVESENNYLAERLGTVEQENVRLLKEVARLSTLAQASTEATARPRSGAGAKTTTTKTRCPGPCSGASTRSAVASDEPSPRLPNSFHNADEDIFQGLSINNPQPPPSSHNDLYPCSPSLSLHDSMFESSSSHMSISPSLTADSSSLPAKSIFNSFIMPTESDLTQHPAAMLCGLQYDDDQQDGNRDIYDGTCAFNGLGADHQRDDGLAQNDRPSHGNLGDDFSYYDSALLSHTGDDFHEFLHFHDSNDNADSSSYTSLYPESLLDDISMSATSSSSAPGTPPASSLRIGDKELRSPSPFSLDVDIKPAEIKL